MKLFSLRAFYNTDFEDLFHGVSLRAVLRLVFDGYVVGIVAGILSSSFRWVLEYLSEERNMILGHHEWYWVVGWLCLLTVMGYLVSLLLKWEPLSSGSGIPQIEGEMMGMMRMRALPVLISKYIGGIFTSLGGFSVGREGPSIQLGGAVGKFISRFFERDLREERVMISAGAAAGLTSAFSAPISGVIFIFEEVHKSFFPVLLIPTFVATLTANYVASLVFGLGPSLGFTVVKSVPIQYFPLLILLGMFIGVVGVLFNRTILFFKKLYDTSKVPKPIQMIFTFLSVGILGYFALDLVGGGNTLVTSLAEGADRNLLLYLLFIFIGKIILTAFCYGSGAQGGIFLPILVAGAAAGSFFYSLCLSFSLIPLGYLANFVLGSMGGIMAAAMRVPLLSILLVLEMTQSFENTYLLGVVAMTAYVTAELSREPPIYDSLLELMKPSNNVDEEEQTILPVRISCVSRFEWLKLKDIERIAPVSISIIGVDRAGHHLIPSPDLELDVGDIIYISCSTNDVQKTKEFFHGWYFMNWRNGDEIESDEFLDQAQTLGEKHASCIKDLEKLPLTEQEKEFVERKEKELNEHYKRIEETHKALELLGDKIEQEVEQNNDKNTEHQNVNEKNKPQEE